MSSCSSIDEEELEKCTDLSGSAKSKFFAKIFSLQTWTCVITVIGIALMITVILYNFYARNLFGDFFMMFVQYLVIYSYATTMLIGFSLVSFASFMGSNIHLRVGLFLLLGGFIFWVFIAVLSFIPDEDLFMFVCVDNRCPETHWMYNTRWRNYGIECPFPEEEGPYASDIQVREDTGFGENPSEISLTAFYAGCENYKTAPVVVSGVLCGCWTIFMLLCFRVFTKFISKIPK